jgi:hypothetical protein
LSTKKFLNFGQIKFDKTKNFCYNIFKGKYGGDLCNEIRLQS